MAIQTVNPSTGELLREWPALTEDALRERIKTAAEAFLDLRAASLEHRALCMRKLAALLVEERPSLARTITLEMGKPLRQAEAEIEKCATACRYYAENAARILAPAPIATDAGYSFVYYEPMGVLLAIMPWNFPLWQVFRVLAPALMAGNVVLLKHAPNVPQCALLIEGLVRRAGFVRGALTALLIESSQVERVLADDRVVAVTLTGSEGAGRAVAAQAGSMLKKSVLELGGSDPFIVMPSADLDQAVAAAITSRTLNAGQSCISAKRFIVHTEIYSAFLHRFAQGMGALRVGDPLKPDTDVGPLSTVKALTTVEQQVQSAVAAGARIVTGGARLIGRGNYYEPTILSDLPRSAPVYREEIFGPVALVFRARNVDEAIEIANDTSFGLGASVWTAEPSEQQRLIASMESGMVFLNTMVASDPRLPFGGSKRSGYGRELGYSGMREFVNAKTVVIA